MKNLLLLFAFVFLNLYSFGGTKDSTVIFYVPDSVKATTIVSEIKLTSVEGGNRVHLFSMQTDAGQVVFSKFRKAAFISYSAYFGSEEAASGPNVSVNADKNLHFDFKYNWEADQVYKIMITIAADSLANFYLSSAYVFLPKENKWKFLGTVRYNKSNTTLKYAGFKLQGLNKSAINLNIINLWCQGRNGSWKNLK